jgi:anaerobic selenocysteine-containing dehydrogenase/Fe-S-cluster-containing dehydrogenase component
MANGLERREFLKVIGATGAGAALTGCGTAGTERLIPYVVSPEEIVPGTSTWYRTTCRECPAGCGMNIRTREGRAVKAEGNPLSPVSHGHLCARGQASLHGLYNPDRVPQALARTASGWDKLSWDEAENRLARQLLQPQGETVFLTHSFNGSLDRLIDDFCAAFNIRRVRYEPFAYEPIRAAMRMMYGRNTVPVHSFENAEVVLTFGADIFETWVSPVDYQHGWGQGVSYRNGRRGRMISVTPHQSLTDMNADEWLPVKPGTEHLVALAMARIIADNGGDPGPGAAMLANVDVAQAAAAAGISPERIRQVATAFANGGRSIAVGPGVASTHAAATAVASAVLLLNQVAGNIGRTVHIDRAEAAGSNLGTYQDMQQLVQRMANGQVGGLLVYGPNPLYELPNRAEVEAAIGQVPFIASFSSYLDETSAHAHLLLPDHHFLESWGDYQPRTGVTAIVQPVMMPVFDSKQTGDVLLSVAVRAGVTLPDAQPTFYDYVRSQWQRGPYAQAGGGASFEDWWRDVLQTGFVVQTTTAPAPAAPAATATLAQLPFGEPEISGPQDGYFLVVYPSARFYDGRNANRPWLQELPDPISKFAWSSWVEINPSTADAFGLDTGHIVQVSTDFGSVELPVWIHPAMRDDTIAIQLGQGHTEFGRYAMNRGVNPLDLLAPLADPVSGAFLYIQQRASLRPTGRWERPIQSGLNADQENREVAQSISLTEARARDTERGLLVALATGGATLDQADEAHAAEAGGHGHDVHPFDARVRELQASGGLAPAEINASPQAWPPEGTHYGEYSETQPRWGMAIDMERCTGCSACITACYAENNIGIVGPEQVAKGRILHWLRIERYFEGEGEDVQTTFLPMLCQQCGNAPCEPVCPVYAAYHTPDGLNGQVYNRCVGTRYCANNCPYKVRTFNWFSWEWPEPLNWQLNPDVTVREKGVMEKCTFCVQRIREKQHEARLQNRGVRDGEIVPACAQTCPSDAIVFGNLKDPNARVTRVANSGRGYRVFEHINTQSAITYLKRVRPEGAEA